MQVNVEKVSSVKRKLIFEIPADRVSSEIERAYDRIKKNASIKGFRKGKVPMPLVEKYFSDRMEEDVLRALFNDTFYKALQENEIMPVSQPLIEGQELKKGSEFTYSATVEVLPDIDVQEYVGLAVKKEKYLPNEEALRERLKQMQENFAQLMPVQEDRPAATGDFVTMDFAGFLGDKPIENGSGSDYELELGSGRFIPGFEEKLLGLKVGEETSFNITFPPTYGTKELAGQEATFNVTLKQLKVKELPELNDDFAQQFGEFENLEQLKKKMAEAYEAQEKERIEGELRDKLVNALIEKNPLEVPDSLVEKQLSFMLERTRERLAYQRLSLEKMGFDEERFKSQYRHNAETQVKGMLLLDAVVKKEAITVSDEEVDRRIEEIAGKSGQNPEGMIKLYKQDKNARENLMITMREDKAIEFLIGKADISELERDKL